MEHLCEEGALQGVVDYTLSELANSLMDGIHATGPERLTVAGRLGLPQVVVPGCVDFFNQGPRDTVPRALPRAARPTSTTRWRRSCGSTATRRPSSARIVAERLNERHRARARRRAHCAGSRSPTPRAATSGTPCRRRVPGRAVRRPAPRHPVRSRRRPRRRPRLRRRRRRALPRPRPGDRRCLIAPFPTASSTWRRRTSPGSRSARTSSWSRSAPASSTARTCRSARTRSRRWRSRGARPSKADVPYTAPFWAGYSPQHMRETESGVGTITLRASTLNAVLYDILRSLIHHGWNKLILVNGHGSNVEGARPAAAPDQVRDRRAGRALQAVRRALHRDPRRAAGEPAGGDARLARVASSRPRR